MPKSALPDDVVETGYVLISVGLDESGVAVGYDYEGLPPEQAIGYLIAFSDILREESKLAMLGLGIVLDDDEDFEEGEDPE